MLASQLGEAAPLRNSNLNSFFIKRFRRSARMGKNALLNLLEILSIDYAKLFLEFDGFS